jgi:hypothetical protein
MVLITRSQTFFLDATTLTAQLVILDLFLVPKIGANQASGTKHSHTI